MYRGEVYVDGACRGNGQPGARGGLGVHFPDLPSQDVSKELGGDRQTNQRAGIQASKEAVRAGADLGYDAIVVKTDNEYVVRAQNEWMNKWRGNGWRNCNGKPVVNRDDFEELQDAIDDSGMAVRFEHTPAGCSRGNQIAEDLARYAYQDSDKEGDDNEYDESGDEEYLHDDHEQGYEIDQLLDCLGDIHLEEKADYYSPEEVGCYEDDSVESNIDCEIDQLLDCLGDIHLEENADYFPPEEVGCYEDDSVESNIDHEDYNSGNDSANDVNDVDETNNEADNGADDQSVGGDNYDDSGAHSDGDCGGNNYDYVVDASDCGGNNYDYGVDASDCGGNNYDYGVDASDYGGDYSGGYDYDYDYSYGGYDYSGYDSD